MPTNPWRQAIRIVVIVLVIGTVGYFTLRAAINYALNQPERTESELRRTLGGFDIPESWRFQAERTQDTTTCEAYACRTVVRYYTSTLDSNHPDACGWAERTARSWSATPPSVTQRNGACHVDGTAGETDLDINVDPTIDPPFAEDPRSTPFERIKFEGEYTNVMVVRLTR